LAQPFWLALTLRLVQSVAVIWVVVTVVFLTSRVVGDPITIMAPINATQADIDRIKSDLGLNDPLIVQYGRFLGDIARLDFGNSFRTGQPALKEVASRLPATLELGVAALVFSIAVGIPLGTVAAVRRGGLTDIVARAVTLLGQAVPNFWLGIMLILVFSVRFALLPTGGSGGLANLVLPTITLGAVTGAAVVRLTRTGMLEVLDADFIRTARSKGLSEFTTIFGHGLRHALLPVITVLGIQAGRLIAGTIVVETVFAWPGMGRLIIQSIQSADYPVVQAGVLIIASVIVLANVAVDISYRLIDPRVQVGL
jgi:peptide/nickel transport system permease protein